MKIDTPRLAGSISLKGGRIDDLALLQFRETVDPKSPPIILYSPSGTAEPYYAEFGWVAATGVTSKMPDAQTVWQQEGSGSLTPTTPAVLKWDNGEGLTFRRTISVDDHYLFTIKDDVSNVGNAPVTLYPFALISRHGTPQVSGYYILHEGLIGYLDGLQEYAYKKIDEAKSVNFKATNGWLGMTDKYWASALLPDTSASFRRSSPRTSSATSIPTRPTICSIPSPSRSAAPRPQTRGCSPAPRKPASSACSRSQGSAATTRSSGLNHFDLLIDWGWFYFITKPMFLGLDFFYRFFGNFGISILLVTVIVKLLFFPLANKSYASMAKMKSVQPQLAALKERYPDDKVKQQQEMMEIYRKEKINPVAGCLPVVIQIPVFFSLYKVLFVTIEMRHAPFFGWIKDLSAPDPTNLFTLFGLLPVRSDAASAVRPLSRARHLADHHGHHDVVPDEAEPDAAGSDAAADLQLDAADLHLHAGGLPGGPRDLLGLEQHALGAPAELHHAPQRREGGAVRQSQGDVREEGDVAVRHCEAQMPPHRHARARPGHPRFGGCLADRRGWPGQARP